MKLNLLFATVLLTTLFTTGSCTTEANDLIVEKTEETTIIPKSVEYSYSPIELQTLALINAYRVNSKLKALDKMSHLSMKSEEHDIYMINNNVVSHDNFTARSENIIKMVGAIKVSENIAYNYNTPQAVFEAWMNSAGHKENIKGDFTHFGIAIRENPLNGKKYYTTIFVKI